MADHDPPRGLVASGFDRLVGRVTPSVIDSVDVEALMQRIDVDAVVQRVDVDALVGRVDLDALMASIDVDALLGRIDVNALMQRVDLDAMLAKVDLDAMLARLDVDAMLAKVDVAALADRAEIGRLVTESSQQVAGSALDLARRQIVGIDFVVARILQRAFRRRLAEQAAGPAALQAVDAADPLDAVGDRRLRVSGRYGGPVSRLLAFVIDSVIVTSAFTLLVAAVSYTIGLVSSVEVQPGRAQGWWWTAGLVAWTFLYGFVSLVVAGRTPGKTLVGLRVVARDGSPVGPRAALIRVVTQPLSFVPLGLGFVGLLLGRERRALHDVLAGTAVVCDWGDRAAELPTPLTRYLERSGAPAAA